jgi:cysteine desulfurase / selenocysteine lyase
VTEHAAYFNCAANAPLPIPVLRAIDRYTADLANHGSAHYLEWFATARRARERAARLIGATHGEIALVRNTSDGLSIVAQGLEWRRGDSVVVVHGDFPANIYPWLKLREGGVEVRFVRPDERHRIHPEQLLAACDASTKVIAVSFVGFASGFRMDLATLAAMAKPRGILLCVDAIQGLGALSLDVERDGIDFLSADGHKWLLTPEGIGVFYVRRALLERLHPPLVSWLSMKDPFDTEHYRGEFHDDARRFEFATPNTAGIYALDAALELLLDIGIDAIEPRVIGLTNRLVDGLRHRGCRVLSPRGEHERSGIVLFDRGDMDPRQLNARLLAAGVHTALRGGAVRASAHFYNDDSDVERLLDALP